MTSTTKPTVIAEDIERILQGMNETLSALSGSTILVTGASGFLCSYFIETVAALNDSGLNPRCRAIVLDNMKSSVPERLQRVMNRSDISIIRHDVTVPLDLGEKVDWIIHGASIASPTLYRRYPLETIDVNVTGTRRMLDLARSTQARGILVLSTSEIYGDPDPAFIPTPEEYRGYVSCTGPRACYDESKRMGETLCVTYHRLFGVPVKIVRPFNVYGPGQPLGDGRIIPDLMKSASARTPIVLFSDGRATRAFCYISDAVRAMWHVLLEGPSGEIFNVGNDEKEVSMAGLADLVRQIAGPPWIDVQHRVSQDVHYTTDNPQRRCPDLTKLRAAFRWRPTVTLSEGLARTLAFYTDSTADVSQESKCE